VDVGREVSEFARGLGLEVLTGELEPGALPSESFDAVFVLNCFEQLPDPTATLWEIRRLLRPAGDLVLRTPSAAFVRQAHLPPRRHHANNRGVLGVPFVRCFSAGALVGVLRAASFTTVAVRGASAPWMDVAARAA
jgi:SAM-dependent methyltransferase